ncbi:MAG: DegT/DnrJ/EryC1/StrS family aminotransferase, partial [Phycisphaerae bacterium]
DMERRVTENTRAIMPVEIGGQPCNMERMMEIAKKHNLKVIEDAAQAHLSEYKGKKLGTIGDLGCFSFQSSKTIACGEGGAIIGNDEELMDKCYTVHNHGTSRRGRTEVAGPKYRMNEFEAAVLLGQLPGVEERFARRNENAAYLTSRLKDIPGIVPQKLYEGTDSGSFYLYMMTYRK